VGRGAGASSSTIAWRSPVAEMRSLSNTKVCEESECRLARVADCWAASRWLPAGIFDTLCE
jgi:hypothetical protein